MGNYKLDFVKILNEARVEWVINSYPDLLSDFILVGKQYVGKNIFRLENEIPSATNCLKIDIEIKKWNCFDTTTKRDWKDENGKIVRGGNLAQFVRCLESLKDGVLIPYEKGYEKLAEITAQFTNQKTSSESEPIKKSDLKTESSPKLEMANTPLLEKGRKEYELDFHHDDVLALGLNPETAQKLSIGFCAKITKLWQNQVLLAVKNADDKIVGYGRFLDNYKIEYHDSFNPEFFIFESKGSDTGEIHVFTDLLEGMMFSVENPEKYVFAFYVSELSEAVKQRFTTNMLFAKNGNPNVYIHKGENVDFAKMLIVFFAEVHFLTTFAE